MRLGAPLDLIVVDAAAKAVQTVAAGGADCGFFAIDPVRGTGIAFTAESLARHGIKSATAG